jgi:hypothetical protein
MPLAVAVVVALVIVLALLLVLRRREEDSTLDPRGVGPRSGSPLTIHP